MEKCQVKKGKSPLYDIYYVKSWLNPHPHLGFQKCGKRPESIGELEPSTVRRVNLTRFLGFACLMLGKTYSPNGDVSW